MTLIKWNAKRPSIFSEFDNLFDSFISDFPTLYERSSSWAPKFEVLNTDNSYRIRADLPGMIKNNVNIEVANNTLKISGERVNDIAESNDYNYSELSYGKFSRTFNLLLGPVKLVAIAVFNTLPCPVKLVAIAVVNTLLDPVKLVAIAVSIESNFV